MHVPPLVKRPKICYKYLDQLLKYFDLPFISKKLSNWGLGVQNCWHFSKMMINNNIHMNFMLHYEFKKHKNSGKDRKKLNKQEVVFLFSATCAWGEITAKCICFLCFQAVSVGKHVKGYHYIIANLVSGCNVITAKMLALKFESPRCDLGRLTMRLIFVSWAKKLQHHGSQTWG